jgi:hypothetical protein
MIAAPHQGAPTSKPRRETVAFEHTQALNDFSVDETQEAKGFSGEMIVLKVSEENKPMSMPGLHIAGDWDILDYPKPVHYPASFTVLDFQVDDPGKAVDGPIACGDRSERSGNPGQDEKKYIHAAGDR